MYSPGDAVKFKAVGTVPAGAKIRYVHQGQVVAEENYAGAECCSIVEIYSKSVISFGIL